MSEIDSTVTLVTPPNHLLCQPVTMENFIPNARVSRNTDWRWGDLDKKGPGILLRKDDNKKGWAFVLFLGSDKARSYRIGDEHGAHDLVYGDQPKDLIPIDVEESLIGEVVTAENFRQGARVSRGAKWTYGYEDNGKPGLLVRLHEDKMLWIRWSDGSENRYLAGFGDIVYGTEPKQPIVVPVFEGKFSLVDRWKCMCAHPSGDVFARDSRNMSCYTEQMFDIETADFEVFFDVRELHDGIAGLGVMKDGNSLLASCRHLVGEIELESSVGIGIERGQAFILANDLKMEVAKANTTGTTLLGMKVRNGEINFSIDGEPFESTPSTFSYVKCLTGMFRVVVSFSKAEQKGLFYTKRKSERSTSHKKKENSHDSPSSLASTSSNFSDYRKSSDSNAGGEHCSPRNVTNEKDPSISSSSNADSDEEETKALHRRNEKQVVLPESEFPHVEWTLGSKFTFFDYVRNVDVVGEEKRELRCITAKRCTLFSNQVFDIETADFEETVYFPGGVLGGDVCFGLVDENPTAAAANCLCGEVEIKNSIGLLLRPDLAALLYKDKVRDAEKWPTTQDTAVTIRVNGGNLSFDVGNRAFSSQLLNAINKKSTESKTFSGSFAFDESNDEHLLVKGKFRLAISLSYQGQVATFDRERGRSRNAGVPQAIWKKGTFFTFHNYHRSIDVIGNKRELVCKGGDEGQSCRATCFSNEIFDLKASKFIEAVTIHGGLCGGEIVVGILGAEPGAEVVGHVCGDVEIPDSLGLIIRADGVSLLHKGTIADREPLPPSHDDNGNIVVKIEADGGKVAFIVNDRPFVSPLLTSLISAKTFTKHSTCKGKYRLGISMTSAGQRATLFGGDIPRRQWTDGNPFTFHALAESMSLIDCGKGARCIANGRSTIYSNEVFDARSVSFVRTFTLHGGTRGGDVCLGFVDENPSLLVNCHVCGDVELQNSIGILLHPGRVGILHRGNIRDGEAAETEDTDELIVTLSCNHGRLSFQLNDKEFSSPYLNNLGFDGKFRLAISLTRRGQRVLVSDPTIAMNLPEVLFIGGANNSNNNRFHLETMSTSASTSKSGIAAWCTKSGRTTVFSREVFDLAETPVSLSVVIEGGLQKGDVSIGFCGARQTKAIATHICGEAKILNSAGVLVRPSRNCMLHVDKISDSATAVDREGKSTKAIVVRINLSQGRMSAMINDRNFHMPSFDNIKLSGKGRLAISMTKQDQKIYLGYDGVTSFEAAGGGDAAEVEDRTLVNRDEDSNKTGPSAGELQERLSELWKQLKNDFDDGDDDEEKNKNESFPSALTVQAIVHADYEKHFQPATRVLAIVDALANGVISSLQQASTSVDFKNAVDALVRSRVCVTIEIRDLILQKQNLIIDTPTADAVVSFLSDFSRAKSTYHLLRTAEIRDLIIDVLAPKISDGDSVENLGRTICVIVENKRAAELYSNQKSFSAMLDCFRRATTVENTYVMVGSINNICVHNPGANKILNDLPVVDAFSAIIPHATTDDSVKWISISIEEILKNNETAQQLFGTPTFVEKFKSMEKFATSADAKSLLKSMNDTLQFMIGRPALVLSIRNASTSTELKTAVDALPRSLVSFTADIRDLILQKQNLITDARVADAVASFLSEFSRDNATREPLRTAEVRRLIVDVLAPKLSASDDVVENLGRMICGIVQDRAAAALYANRKSLTAILDCFHRAPTAASAQWIAYFVSNVSKNIPFQNTNKRTDEK